MADIIYIVLCGIFGLYCSRIGMQPKEFFVLLFIVAAMSVTSLVIGAS